ncbi:MAG TPA: ElyC/SanA/YdcF family protein [Pontiellaceae bacterium]|nr:ElyC/SanA/YdcF family protein [Pontiellaceae bacterium]
MKLVCKKEVWMPTWQGFVSGILLAGTLICGAVCHLYPFLAQNHPQPAAGIIIIEGWMADAELKAAAGAIQPGQIVVTTGGPVTFGQKILQYDNYAELGTARLVEYGIPASSIITIPAPDTQRDRTYVSAVAARAKLEELGLFGKSANLYTVGAHARRSYLLFRHVFGRNYPLGVIAVEPPSYNLSHWYRHSAGFKHVVTEFISWIYAQFFLLTHV